MKCTKCNTKFDGNFCPACGNPAEAKKKCLLGFRSNKIWKKILSICYLSFCLIAVLFTVTQGNTGKVTTYDFMIQKIFETILCFCLISPYLFLSNTKFRTILPLFKKNKIWASILGMFIIIIILLIGIGVVNSFHTDEYKADMENHAYIKENVINASCTKKGKISYYCEYCGKSTSKSIPATGHKMTEISRKEASCDTEGNVIFKCEFCENETNEKISSIGHNMVEVSRVNSTSYENGQVIKECTRCGYNKTEKLDKLNPSPTHPTITSATEGKTEKTDVLATKAQINLEDDNKKPEYYEVFKGVIDDEVLIKNICSSMLEIGISPDEISSLTQTDNWVAGCRYNFKYKNLNMTIYTNMNSTVYSINLGVDCYVYLQGYEPYNINDYLIDNYMKSSLKSWAKDEVKSHLNYPSSADFPLLDWTRSRDHNLYTVSSYVNAKNAFGVGEEIPFTLTYYVKDNSAQLVYFIIDSSVVVDKTDTLSIPVRKTVSSNQIEQSEENTSDITLVYGQLGKYGKEIILDGEKYVNFHIPLGTYTVKSNVNWCVMYIAEDKYYENSVGYMDNEIVETIVFDSSDKTVTITVEKGEHIELSLHGSVTLTPQND